MLLALLLHLLIFHLLTARDVPARKDTQYVIQHIESCPNVGYYFRREPAPNAIEPPLCYLCFCQEDNTAVCWKRDNRRCNVESFHYHGVGKRDTRFRRSPGFSDIFFRDASRDFFNKNEKTQCKPFESSFSDDCPPADWCTGCTVCDCDANGRWDCHILSFCPDEKNKKKSKNKGPRKVVVKKRAKPNKAISNMPKRVRPNTAKITKPTNKGKNESSPAIKREGSNKSQQKRIVKKSVPVRADLITPASQKKRTPIRYKRISPTKAEPTKQMIIKKNVATHKPIDIKATKVNLEMEIAQKVMKKVMANLRKSVQAEVKDMSKIAQKNAEHQQKRFNNVKKAKSKPKPRPKVRPKQRPKPKPKPKHYPKKVNKRQIKKPQRKPSQKKPIKKPVKKPVIKPKPKSKKPTKKPTTRHYVRNRRDLNMLGNTTIPSFKSEDSLKETTVMNALAINTLAINTSAIDMAQPNTTVLMPIALVTSNLLMSDDDNCSHTPAGSSTLPGNEYYKYVVGAEEPKVDGLIEDTGTNQVNMTETVFNLIGTHVTTFVSTEKSFSNNNAANKVINLTEFNPDMNELKYFKWPHMKVLKEKKIKSSLDKHRNVIKLKKTNVNKTIVLEDNKKYHGKSVERKINARKFNIVKLLNRHKCKVNRDKQVNNSHIQRASKNIGDLGGILSNLLREYHRNYTTHPPKKRKFSVLRYLKRFFNKIFKRRKITEQISKHHLIETLCDNFGPCSVNKKDKVLLNAKLKDLDDETSNILKTVKIIKGLLRLVDLPESTVTASSNHDNNFHNDIKKLNNILKGAYSKDDRVPLTVTQRTQIDYIKKNTQDFIKSVSKFATLLNEIIGILTEKTDVEKIAESTTPRINYTSKELSKGDPFQGFRELLVRYNLVQNSFMKRMYEQLNNFETIMNEKPKVSEVKELNNSVAIENFSRNIIQNLRKLKRLAQTVSYSGRTKREATRDDDAIEYLLMLMEYLLKQNHPLDAAPVNDGIDLLIEAIKNAPDIKPIKKKVLEYTPATEIDTTTTSATKSVTTESSSDDDSLSDSEKTSSEDTGKLKIDYTEDNLKNKEEERGDKDLVEIIAEDDKEPEDKYQYDRRAGTEKIEDNTEMALYNRIEDNVILESDNIFETTTSLPIEMDMNDKLDNQEENIIDKPLTIDSKGFDKAPADDAVSEKRFEVFTGDLDEEAILPGTVTVTETELSTPVTTEFSATQAKKSRTKMRQLHLESDDSESVDKKSKLEWIEENFGRENEKEFTDDDYNTTVAVTTPRVIKPTLTTDKADISSLTKELGDETDKKNKSKLNAEDVMLRKQMDLLNSLDYGTEKGEVYESDSKDGNEDKYSGDTFPSYFV